MQALMGLFTGGAGAAAAGGAVAGAGAAAAGAGAAAAGAGSMFSLSSLLQGGLTVLSAVSAINAGNEDAENFEAQAQDAEREKPLETLQGIQRRTGLKEEYVRRIGEQDVAYAASGTDVSFGTPGQAKREASRELDLGLETDTGTEQTRIARLTERSANYMRMAGRARKRGRMEAIGIGLGGAAKILDRG